MVSSKMLAAGSTVAAIAVASPTFPFGFSGNAVCLPQEVAAPGFPVQNPSAASSYCTSYFRLSPATNTVVQTSTASPTVTSTVAGTTSTVTPTITSTTIASTCYFTPTASGQLAARTAEPNLPGFANPADFLVQQACVCNGVNLNKQTTTVTSTQTITKAPVTATVTGAPQTVTASPVTVTKTGISTVPASAATAPGGTKYLVYPGYDFYGNDLASNYCGANGQFPLPNGTSVTCTGFETCRNVCESYNQATGTTKCVGVSYLKPNVFCYLKTTVNVCDVMPNSNVDSAAVTS